MAYKSIQHARTHSLEYYHKHREKLLAKHWDKTHIPGAAFIFHCGLPHRIEMLPWSCPKCGWSFGTPYCGVQLVPQGKVHPGRWLGPGHVVMTCVCPGSATPSVPPQCVVAMDKVNCAHADAWWSRDLTYPLERTA